MDYTTVWWHVTTLKCEIKRRASAIFSRTVFCKQCVDTIYRCPLTECVIVLYYNIMRIVNIISYMNIYRTHWPAFANDRSVYNARKYKIPPVPRLLNTTSKIQCLFADIENTGAAAAVFRNRTLFFNFFDNSHPPPLPTPCHRPSPPGV